MLIGLLAIALSLFFGLFFGLSGLRKSIGSELSVIKEKIVAIQIISEKLWDVVAVKFAKATVVRKMPNLGGITISVDPGPSDTTYRIVIEKPVLIQGLIVKASKQTELADKEIEMFGEESRVSVIGANTLHIRIPTTEPELATQYMSFFLRWLDSTYFEWTKKLEDFEKPILTSRDS